MANESDSTPARRYAVLLTELCSSGDDGLLSKAATLSEGLVAAGIEPHEITAMHAASVQEVVPPDDARAVLVAQRLLLEVMIAYGVTYTATAQRLLAEANAAAAMEHDRAEDAQRAEKERLEVLAGVSHELGTPLTVVKGNVSAIRQFLEENHGWPEELTPRADDVEFAVERMLALREDLLAASRNEKRELELVPLHLVRCMHRAVRWARVSASEKGIELTEVDSAKIPYVIGDDEAVQAIFSNLLSNAVRYTPNGGSISVKVSNERSRVAVEVTDTGIGMSEAEQERIFERFYRTPEAKKMVSFGLGLGLALSRDLVSALAGTIEVSSVAGAGSIFKVTLPIANMGESELESSDGEAKS